MAGVCLLTSARRSSLVPLNHVLLPDEPSVLVQDAKGLAPTKAPFNFGAPPASAAAPSLFSFGASSAAPVPGLSLGSKSSTSAFGLGSSAPFSFGAGSTPSFMLGGTSAAGAASSQPSGSAPAPSGDADQDAASAPTSSVLPGPASNLANGDVPAAGSAMPAAPFNFNFGQVQPHRLVGLRNARDMLHTGLWTQPMLPAPLKTLHAPRSFH